MYSERKIEMPDWPAEAVYFRAKGDSDDELNGRVDMRGIRVVVQLHMQPDSVRRPCRERKDRMERD